MAVSRSHATKQPSQNPTDFYKGVQQGGAYGKGGSVPDKLSGGPMREKTYGPGALNKSK